MRVREFCVLFGIDFSIPSDSAMNLSMTHRPSVIAVKTPRSSLFMVFPRSEGRHLSSLLDVLALGVLLWGLGDGETWR